MTQSQLPSDIYYQDFVDGKKGTRGNDQVFKTMPRAHLQRLDNMHSIDEKIDAGKYAPQFTAVELNIARDIVFSANQSKRRSAYFEGQEEIYLVGG